VIIPQAVLNIISQINACGFDAYPVGGCVRDILMGQLPCDWDIATSATPDKIQKIFNQYTVIPTGIKHGTVTVILDKIPFEITTFRIDGNYTDSRHPENVTFSTSLVEDLKRRDFTINAIAYHPESGIVDPLGGQADLKAGIIRAVGDPAQRFSEDALRIMRAIRFSAVLDFEIEPETAKALYKYSHLLENIAAERVTTELNKTLCANGASLVIEKYFSVISQRLFGNYPLLQPDTAVFRFISRTPCKLSLRLAAFLFGAAHVFNTDATSLAKTFFSHLKYDNKTRSKTTTLLANLHRSITLGRISIRRIIRDIGADTLQDIFELKVALQIDKPDTINMSKIIISEILRDGDCCHLSDLAINGNDLASQFNLKGAEIGNALNTLLDAVIEDKCPNTRSSLLEYYKMGG